MIKPCFLSVCVPNRKLADGLFLQCCKEVAAGYPDITFDSMIVDNTTMQVSGHLVKIKITLLPFKANSPG